MYVDDWLSGADNVNDASSMLHEAQRILADAGMVLTKWHTNSKFLIEQDSQQFESHKDETKLLGMFWNSSKDIFSFEAFNLPPLDDLIYSKRNVLSIIAHLFDPIGLISPFVMYAKILMQDVWRLGLNWDEVLPMDLQHKFKLWFSSICHVKLIELPHSYFPGKSLNSVSHLELHAFSDASEKGYGTCIYLRYPVSDNVYSVSFVMSRGKVAPIKLITLPRLELLGALMSARLITFVKSSLCLPDNVKIYCWSDSQIVLSSIKAVPSK